MKTIFTNSMILLTLIVLMASCATKRKTENQPIVFEIERELEELPPERELFVPVETQQTPAARPRGEQAVRNSLTAGVIMPSEYSHAAMIYNFGPDRVYEVYTRPLRITTIRLESGEQALEPPFVSDSERWILGAGVSFDGGIPVQQIYVKPSEAGLEASLIINTDRRSYHIILRSFRETYMPLVRFRYTVNALPATFITPVTTDGALEHGFLNIDPRSLSFNYRIRRGFSFPRPAWTPEHVFDDGRKTYISFPAGVLQRELPAVFENRRDVVNYRVAGQIIVIDKLVENLTIKIGRSSVSIERR